MPPRPKRIEDRPEANGSNEEDAVSPGKGLSALAKAGPWRGDPRIAKLITWLDDGITVPGTKLRIGLDPIIGLFLPEIGDVLSGLISAAILLSAWREKLPTAALARMVFHIGVDAVVGAIPVVGDLFDFVYKANRKNAEILEKYRDTRDHKPSAVDHAILAFGILFTVGIVLLPLAVTIFVARAIFVRGW